MAGSKRNLYLAATVSCLTAALFGYSVGFIGGEIVLPSFLAHFHLDHLPPQELAAARSHTVTAWIVGALFGVPLSMPVCSRLGRRLCLQFAAVLYVAGAVLQLFSGGNLHVFQMGRLVNGLGVGAGTLGSPIYISEISPASDRGMLMSGYQVAVQTGALIGFWGAFVSQATLADTSALQWQLPVGAQFFAGLILLAGTLIVPESPRYLAERGHHDAVAEALSWLRRLPQSDPRLLAEREEIGEAAALGEKLKGHHSFTGELRKKDVRRRLSVGVGLMVAQNMVGLNALNYYAPVIFMSAGFTSVSSSLFLTGLFGVVKLISATAFMFVFVRVRGNRFWLRLGSAVCAVAMLVLAYNVRLLPGGPDAAGDTPPTRGSGSGSGSGIVSVAMVYLFAFAFGVSLGPISWNVCSEIFPLHINATCCAITTCTQWVFQIVIAAITPPLLAGVGWATYLIYAAFCILSFVWVHFCVPETRGVGVGRPMDDVFGAGRADGDHGGGGDERQQDEEEEAFLDVSETTALLLAYDRRRRSSLAAYT